MSRAGRTACTAGGREYAEDLGQDFYCWLYFANLTLRPFCHACHFDGPDRESDITLGGLWGVERIPSETDDGMGIPLVILHTDRTQEIWSKVQNAVDWFSCEEAALQPRLKGRMPPSGISSGWRKIPGGTWICLWWSWRTPADIPPPCWEMCG